MSDTAAARPRPATAELFRGFLQVGLSGFGGVLPFARRMLVEERRWLTEQEFTEVLSLSQFLPGPNIVNVSIIVGRRFHGPLGALVATIALMAPPLAIVLVLATLFAQVADVPAVRGACTAVSAAASGLVLTTAIRMAGPIRTTPWQLAIAGTVFAAIGLARASMLAVLAVVVPASLALAWLRRR